MRGGLLTAVFALILCSCGEQPALYGNHSYNCCVENTGTLSWHAGQHVTLHWQPTPPSRTTDPNPHQLVLSISLTGPFSSVDTLKQAVSQGSTPAGVTTINAAPIRVNDRDVVAPASELDLPSALAPGYYNLETKSASGGDSSGGTTVVHVIPP